MNALVVFLRLRHQSRPRHPLSFTAHPESLSLVARFDHRDDSKLERKRLPIRPDDVLVWSSPKTTASAAKTAFARPSKSVPSTANTRAANIADDIGAPGGGRTPHQENLNDWLVVSVVDTKK
jgi:hypothetical protein